MSRATSKRIFLIHALAFFGYFSSVLQWLWIGILFIPELLRNDSIRTLLMPPPADNQATRILPPIDDTSIIMTIIAISLTIIILGITAFVLIRLPIAFVNVSKIAIDKSTEVALPLVTHHKKLPQKQKRLISQRLRIYIKLIIVLLPVLLLSLTLIIPVEIDVAIVLFVGAVLAVGSLLWFALEHITAHVLKIPFDKVP